MASWYLCDDHTDDPIGPMDVDELVARAWDGSLTADARLYAAGVTEGWQPVRDVPVVGPLLDAVTAARPSRRRWRRLQRRREDGTLWRHIGRSRPFVVGAVVFGVSWLLLPASTMPDLPRWSILWCAAAVAHAGLACLAGLLAQVAWYFTSDEVRDRRAGAGARASSSGAGPDESGADIFVYELSPEVRARLKEFDAI